MKKIVLILFVIILCGCSKEKIKEPTEQALDNINNASNTVFNRNAELYLRSAELSIARYSLYSEIGDTTCKINSEGNLTECSGIDYNTIINVEVNGTKPIGGIAVFKNGKIVKGTIIQYSNGEYKVE